MSHDELRQQWIAGGARWWSEAMPPPPSWDPFIQLLRVIDPCSAQGTDTTWQELIVISPRSSRQAEEPRKAVRRQSVFIASTAFGMTQRGHRVIVNGMGFRWPSRGLTCFGTPSEKPRASSHGRPWLNTQSR
jgi:hypothetical protein